MNDFINKAREFKKEFITENPLLKEEVNGLFDLMVDEIENGESLINEYELFMSSCKDLI